MASDEFLEGEVAPAHSWQEPRMLFSRPTAP